MKTVLLLSTFVLLCSTANAEEFTFNFRFEKETFQVKAKGSDRNEASGIAAKKCFQHFTRGTYPGEVKGMKIIDTCANPDSTQEGWYE